MSRAMLIIHGDASRQKAIHWASRAPLGTRITFQAAQRTLDQNSRMWAMLTKVSSQIQWHGVKLAPDDWKLVFLDALKRELGSELRLVPNLDHTGFVNVGTSSSDLSKEEMTGLIDLIFKFGAENGVTFQEPAESEAA